MILIEHICVEYVNIRSLYNKEIVEFRICEY